MIIRTTDRPPAYSTSALGRLRRSLQTRYPDWHTDLQSLLGLLRPRSAALPPRPRRPLRYWHPHRVDHSTQSVMAEEAWKYRRAQTMMLTASGALLVPGPVRLQDLPGGVPVAR